MPCYLVCYETSTAKKLRERVLAGYKIQCQVTETCWAIVTDQKSIEIRDYLASVIGPQDRLFVIRTGGEGAWRNSFGEAYTNWLKERL